MRVYLGLHACVSGIEDTNPEKRRRNWLASFHYIRECLNVEMLFTGNT
jgi:hypothetical protein